MPTTITSAGITFNDTTSQTTSALAAGAIGTTQLAANAVTAAKLGANEQKQICKAFVNFNGISIAVNAVGGATGENLATISGTSTLTWTIPTAWQQERVGTIYFFQSNGSSVLGGVNVSGGMRLTSFSGTAATMTLLSGATFTSSTTYNGNNTSTGYTYSSSGIRSSYNVSSITKLGTGEYQIGFQTPMADAFYTLCGSGSIADASTFNNGTVCPSRSVLTPLTTTSARVAAGLTVSPQVFDFSITSVQIFGN